MVFDVQSFMSQGMALYTESRTAKKAWISAACALAQAKYLFEKGPADPDLLQKFEEAKEDESKKQERCRDIQERLAKHDSEREAWVNYLAAPKLTMQEAVQFQYPLLEEPSDPGRPLSNPQSVAPQTYTEILPWELSEGACELVNGLDNTQRLYYKPACHAQLEGSFEAEIDIRGRVFRVMDTVNYALKQLGSAVRCHGGGQGRSMSFADLVMRLDRKDDNNLKDLSGRVLGTVLVKKNLGLKQGESLQEAIKDPQRGGRIKAVVQEAYGMAVVDEAPVFALTSYNVTVFFKRSDDVRDTRLWASEPAWINQTDPSAAAVWVLVLLQAEQLGSWKALLPRAEVPSKIEEEESDGSLPSIISPPTHPTYSGVSNFQRQLAAIHTPASSVSLASITPSVNSDPVISRKRRHAEEQHTDFLRSNTCPRLNLQACSPYNKASQDNVRASEPQPDARDFEAKATLPLSVLGLTGEILEASQYSYTLKGFWGGEPAAVKVFNLRKRGAAAQYETEKIAYSSRSGMHGNTNPRFLCSGLQAHTAAPVIVASYEGKAAADEPVPEHLH